MGAVLVAAAVAAAIVCASGCLTRFDTDRPHFDACKSNVCFLFLQDEPHIVFASRASARQQLFPCASPASAPGGLSGSFFAVANRTVPDALCVWAGTGCTFAGLTAFLATTSASSPSHQFAAGGVLLESPARVTDTLHPSSSIIDSSLVIIGPAATGSTSSAPVAVLLRPLTASAWGLLVFILALFGVVGIAVLTVLAPGPVRWSTLFFHVIGEEEADAEADAQLARGVSGGTLARGGSGGTNGSRRESLARGRLTDSDASSDGDRWGDAAADALLEKRAARATYRAALWLYRAALSAFLIMFVLFYEISVVNVLFMQTTAERLRKSTEKLSRRELGHYAVLRASAIEEIWRKTVDPRRIYDEGDYPWYRCETSNACFDMVLNKSNTVNFVVTFDNFARYEMMNREVCNKLTTYATERRLYAFGAGWLFGAGVPAATRRRIDKGILDLRMTDEMRGLLDPHDGKTCKPSRPDIDADIVGVAILILVGPSVIMLTVIMCVVRMKDSGPEARDDWVFILRGRGRDVSIG